ncbi:oligoendopeptidase F [Tepidimicrobium xylanilyticum]|uniref:Oligopeptidase F n=1 Tax=Tepidimicrobium xylanilyticum TaxID=1123352 RepID=A0A1H3DRJ4_9FIRM|nr:oligoendopeptidase F [Tepidimicrobium xylanilyticum]SDX69016.1 oligopeptidase F. Metallo peptidase. MEROPS family M03B [Tepidimicrobium xylanilyticum]
MAISLLDRKDVDERYTWDLSSIFKTEEEYEKKLEELVSLSKEAEEEFKGKLKDPKTINDCLDKLRVIFELGGLLGSYSYLYLAVDQTNTQAQTRQMRTASIISEINSRLSFIESEIIQLDEELIRKAMEVSEDNKLFLKEIMDKKPHALSPEVEKTLSALSNILDAPYQIYNRTKLADMDFENFTVDGEEYPLSFVLFEEKWEYETDTKLRRAAAKAFARKLRKYQHTIATVYQTQVQKEKIIANLRGFDSVFDSLLFSQKVDRELYDRQIDLIMEGLAPHMRKYAKLIQKIHNLDEMTFMDLKLAVDPEFEPKISIEEARTYVEEALSLFGEDYLNMVKRAFDERWIDFVQNKGKSTGAFCSSPYGSHPFILISWTEMMKEVFVLAHELGHAGHFYLAHKHNNIFNTRPSKYLIEAPSTMNEMLMANYLMRNTEDKRMKRWVLSIIISRTYYHNFVTHLLEAAFQREVYRIIDDGGPIHAELLNKFKRKVLEKFWGDVVIINEGAELTWMRQPHYYMGLYPYTYSAGLTIATEVNKRILSEGQKAIDDWLEVLKSGGIYTPIEFAKKVGVDITTEKPLLNTIEYIGEIIDEIIELTEELDG